MRLAFTRPRLIRACLIALAVMLAIDVICALPGLANSPIGLNLRKSAGMLVVLGSTVLCVLRPIRVRHERLAWACVAAFLVCNTLGAAYYIAKLALLPARPAPSLVDVFWFLRYPFLLAGVHLLVRSRTTGFRLAQWVDGTVGAASLVAISGLLVIQPVLTHFDMPVPRAIFVAYPLANTVAAGFLVGIVAVTGLRLRSWWSLAASLTVFVITDGLYDRVFALTGKAPFGGIYDAGYLSCAWLLAYAAWQPIPREREEDRPRGASSVLPLVFAALGLTLLSVGHLRDQNAFVLAGAVTALVGVLVRQALFARDNRRLLVHARYEAVTDALTDLPNRRSLLNELDHRFETSDEYSVFWVSLMDLDGFKGYNDTFGHHAGDDLLARLAGKLDRAVAGHGLAYRLGGDEFCVVTNFGEDHGGVCARAAAALYEEGKGFKISCSYGTVAAPEEASDAGEVLRLADSRMYAQKGKGRRTRQADDTTAVLAAVLRECNPDLGGHTDGVAVWAVRVAEQLGLSPALVEEVRLGAMLHDIGKMAIPDAILEKPGPLDASEWDFMRRHTVIGARIIEAAPDLLRVAKIVRSHHERWDGSGYPAGLVGEEIPISARIVSVCDAFHAMIIDRPYRRGRPVHHAVEELRRCAGSQFDPAVVEVFAALVEDFGAADDKLSAAAPLPDGWLHVGFDADGAGRESNLDAAT